MWDDQVHVSANDDCVVLTGIVRSRTAREMAERLAQNVPGVARVDNQLVADADVEIAVAQALATDARTASAFPGLLVGVVFGIVYLKGTAPTSQIKDAATEVARTVPGVRRVSNELIVLSEPKAAPKPTAPVKAEASVRPAA
jgi:osmotically-inducible protein OsmY